MSNVPEFGHAPKSPSKSYQWGTCSGSPALIATIPKEMREGSSEFAQLGQATHHLIEKCSNERKEPKEFQGRVIEIILDIDGNEGTSMLRKGAKMPGAGRVAFEVDEEMIDNATMYTDYIARCLVERDLTMEDVTAERRVNCFPERDDCYGTGDTTLDGWPDLLEQMDYKNGAGVLVEVEGNSQTMSYLLGVALETEFSHERYRHTICQPNMAHPDGHIRSEDVTADELRVFHADMLKCAERVDEATAAFEAIEETSHEPDTSERAREWEDTYLAPGVKTCQFCEAYAICNAAQRKVFEIAGADFDDDPEFEIDIPFSADAEKVGKFLMWAPLFEGWLKAIHAYGQNYLENGGDIELIQQKLVLGQSRREWKGMTERKRLATLKKLIGPDFDCDAFYTKVEFISGPQAEKLIPREMREQFNEDLLHKPTPGLTMAPLADAREAVIKNAADDFEDEDL